MEQDFKNSIFIYLDIQTMENRRQGVQYYSSFDLVANNMVFHLKDQAAKQLTNKKMVLIALWLINLPLYQVVDLRSKSSSVLPTSSHLYMATCTWPGVGSFLICAERKYS